MYQLNSDFPVPERRERQTFPWREMKVGDSFAVPSPEGFQTLRVRSARAAMVKAQKTTGFRFTSKQEDGFVRFWRVS